MEPPPSPASRSPRPPHAARAVGRCDNCGEPVAARYCPVCGQKDGPFPEPAHRYLVEAVQETFEVDGKLWRTLGALFFHPGRLTNEYLAGRRVRYARPVRLYLTASVVFFFLLSLGDPIGRFAAEIDSRDAAYMDSLRTDSLRADSLRADSLRRASPVPAATHLAAVESALDSLRAERARLAALPPDSLLRPGTPARSDSVPMKREEVTDMDRTLVEVPERWQGRRLQAFEAAQTWDERRPILADLARDFLRRVPPTMFVMLPLFALLLKGLYARPSVRRGWARLVRRPLPPPRSGVRLYAEHVVFALHTHAFAFYLFAVMLVLSRLGGAVPAAAHATGPLTSLLGLWIPVYFFLALRAVYREGWLKTAVKYAVLGCWYAVLLTLGLVGAIVVTAAFA